MSLVLMSCTAVRAAPAAAAAPSRALRILRLSPDDGVYGKVPDLTVTFNQPVAVDSVHYATAVEEAAGRLTLVRNPVVTATARPDSVQLALGPLRPGPYSVVLGPSISSTQGALLGTADVFDFVYAPAPVAWQEVQTGQGRFTVWALASGERCGPRRDSYLVTSAPTIKPAYVRLLCANGHEQAVSALYATTASGVLVTSQSLTDQLVFDAEMQGWVLGAPVPAAGVLIAPATSQWAQSNGPGSPLLAALYAMAKASGATPERPPSRMHVYTTVLASGIADGGAPGEWHGQSQADLSAVARMLQGVNTVAEGVNLLVELVQTTSDLSVPGAEAVGLAVAAAKAAGSGTQITWDSLAALTAVQVTARAVDAAAPAFTSVGRESPDPALAATIASLLQFRVQRVQAALAATYAAQVATVPGGAIASALASRAIAEDDPLAGSVVLGLHLGFFLAAFTEWDVIGAGFYQAAYIDNAAAALAVAARRLQAAVEAAPAPPPALVQAALLAQRLQWAAAADFYATAVDIVRSDGWAEVVDQDLAGVVGDGSAHLAAQNLPAWKQLASGDQVAAGRLLPGDVETVPPLILGDAAAFPLWPAPVRTLITCGMTVTAPGTYVLKGFPFTPDPLPLGEGTRPQGCMAGVGYGDNGVVVASPGVVLDLSGSGYDSVLAPAGAGILLTPNAVGALVQGGSVVGYEQDSWAIGLQSEATGVYVRNLSVEEFTRTGIWIDHGGGDAVFGVRMMTGDQAPGMGLQVSDSAHVRVAGSTFASTAPAQPWAAIALTSTSDSTVIGNTITSVGQGPGGHFYDGIYVGCRPPAPEPAASCPVSASDQITANTIIVNNNTGSPSSNNVFAVALDLHVLRAVVEDNVFRGSGNGDVTWDSAPCGTNSWQSNKYEVGSAGYPVADGNHTCIR